MEKVEIKNFVCSANLGMRFNLSDIVLKSDRKIDFASKKNSSVLMKISAPAPATAILFASGKCTGVDSEKMLKSCAMKFTQIIQKMDYPVNLIDFKIQNIIGKCQVPFRIKLEELAYAHAACCTYEPELHPGLVYRMPSPKVIILVFASGKIVFTKSKDINHLNEACRKISPVLKKFQDSKPIINESTPKNISIEPPSQISSTENTS